MSNPHRCKAEPAEVLSADGKIVGYFCAQCRKRGGVVRCEGCKSDFVRAITPRSSHHGWRWSLFCTKKCGSATQKKKARAEKRAANKEARRVLKQMGS